MFAILRTVQLVHTWKSILWWCVAVAFSVAGVIAGAGIAGTTAVAVGVGAMVGALSSKAALGAIAVIGVVVLTLAVSVLDLWSAVRIPVFLAIVFGLAMLGKLAGERRHQGVFLFLFIPGMILVCFTAAHLLPPLDTWETIGPLLLFLGLLTLLNAPFDWASLGLTRALLRRGLELGGWWPYALAIVDAALAAVIIAVLAMVMVVGVQAFDSLAEQSGGEPVLPLDRLFNGIAAHPTAPEYWWLYALLLSTMIPSLVNLVIGGASLLRGVPGLPSLLLRSMPARSAVLRWDRAWIAFVLTGQIAVGGALGIAAQAFLAIGIIGYIMPWLGLGLLDMARDVAAFNLPARVAQLFGVSL